MGDVRIDVRYHEGPRLKVVWSDEVDFSPYYIDSGNLKDFTKAVRASLQNLVDAYMQNGSSGASGALKALALAGRDLYDALFLDDGRSQTPPARVKHWFSRVGADRLTISIDNRIYVPWGLVFDGDPNALPDVDVADASVYGGFWCLKYKLAVVHFRITPDLVQSPLSLETLRILPVVDRAAFASALDKLPDAERDAISGLQQRFGPPAYGSPDIESRLGPDVAILYFFCHANGTKLQLDAKDVLAASRLTLLFGRAAVQRTQPCMVFLNGCSTATGHPDGGFVEATVQGGMCGFIGTEALVPDVFALRFSQAFLTLFLRGGRPVYDVMHELLRRHFPLSLVYSIYTYPLLRVEAGPHLEATVTTDENFSFGILGSNTL